MEENHPLNAYQVFHSPCEHLRKRVHVVLTRPEYGGNVGSTARALQNMGVLGRFCAVASRESMEWSEARKMAKHAASLLNEIEFFNSLAKVVETFSDRPKTLFLAASARVGSAHRPHPLKVRQGVSRAIEKLKREEVNDIVLVFGPESDGLSNEEIDLCDWIVTIPSHQTYRSINLAQSVLLFAHEVNENLLESDLDLEKVHSGQRERLITHLLQLAEDAGFILPGDPLKMKPRLEEIFAELPRHIKEIKTIHGLVDQVRRSLKESTPDIRGRYRAVLEGRVRERGNYGE